jgi:2-(1,2-epoxy-1,2-dihydrophenyl)acetyl-CoA isomerase
VSTPFETLELQRDGAAATILLNRPQALNAWDETLANELAEVIAEISRDATVRAVLLTGAGRSFSAGADIKAGFPATAEGHPDVHTRLVGVHHPVITGLREMPKPVVAAVRGAAAGIGCSLALACDLVIAADSAYFLLAFVNIGLAPDGGASAFVAVRAGLGRALEMSLLGEPVPAARALEWGLANRVVADEALDEEARLLVRRLADGPTLAYAAAKRVFNRWAYAQLASQLALEADEQQVLAATHDHAEGIAAFAEKRPPSFRGR